MLKHGERYGDDDLFDDAGNDCPICRGDISPKFAERMRVAADQPGISMTFDEAIAWFRNLPVSEDGQAA